jgi:hypothetical protein
MPLRGFCRDQQNPVFIQAMRTSNLCWIYREICRTKISTSTSREINFRAKENRKIREKGMRFCKWGYEKKYKA